jgi:hypothetical protein
MEIPKELEHIAGDWKDGFADMTKGSVREYLVHSSEELHKTGLYGPIAKHRSDHKFTYRAELLASDLLKLLNEHPEVYEVSVYHE